MGLFQNLFGGSPKAPAPSETPQEIIEYYRKLGYFAGQTTESVLSTFREEWGKEPTTGQPFDDVWLLRYDARKIWADDPEADVCEANQVYMDVLAKWGKITDGVFSPTEIEEKWESETGPIEVSFILDGKRRAIHPKYQDDWIDLEVLTELNRILEPTGRRYNCALDGNFCLLLFLDPQTEKKIRKERRFPFALK
jgi:hypothetical protein